MVDRSDRRRIFNDVKRNRISTFIVTASLNQNYRLTIKTCSFKCQLYVHVVKLPSSCSMIFQHYLDNLNLSKQLESQKDLVEIQKNQLETQNNLITLQSGMVDMFVY